MNQVFTPKSSFLPAGKHVILQTSSRPMQTCKQTGPRSLLC